MHSWLCPTDEGTKLDNSSLQRTAPPDSHERAKAQKQRQAASANERKSGLDEDAGLDFSGG